KKSGKFKVLLNYYDERYVEGILIFVTDMLNSKNHPIEKVTELFSGISPEIDKEIMTVRQAIEQKGIQKGILNTAKSMLKHGISLDLVKKTTGLTKKDIETISKKK
ncbi:MAG: hypothetical protein GY830_05015, partial [Bacteroidetes bacterium]|nr:hypothetical protein [Bacteroidota bacterium]